MRHRVRTVLAPAVVVLATLLAGCAALTGGPLEKPRLELLELREAKGDLFEQRVTVRMRVTNPNDRDLPVRGLDVVVELDGAPFAAGSTAREFTVPARAQAEFDMEVRADAVGALVKLLKQRGSGAREASYLIRGTVRTKLGLLRSVPFEEKGAIRLGR